MEKGVCVRILDKEFRVACPKGQEESLREAAHYLDQQMRIIRQTGRVIGIERIAVMAGLNISAQLLSRQTEPGPDDFSDRLKLLQDKIDDAISSAPTRKEPLKQEIATDAQNEAEVIL